MDLEQLRTLFSGLMLVSLLFVILNFWFERKRVRQDYQNSKDKEVCDQAVRALERAYRTLVPDPKSTLLPQSNRLIWLTAARLLVRYQNMKENINSEVYKIILNEHEDYWRFQFYLSLGEGELKQSSYFQIDGSTFVKGEHIEAKSALVIANFSQWGADSDDPLEQVSEKELSEDKFTLNGQPGLRDYIAFLSRLENSGKSME